MAGKQHRVKKKGAKANKNKKAARKKGELSEAELADARARNPKAFSYSGTGKAKIQQARSADKEQRRLHLPLLEQFSDEPPPFVVLVHGPPGVGKTTLIRCLVKHYTRHTVTDLRGPITVVSGKKRRLTFIECPQDLNAMIDAAKYADLVLLMVDGAFGFEMETFELLNMLQTHGFPKVMGVLTHLDGFKDPKKLKKTKKALKARFWTEIYDGAKLFYLSGIQHGKYTKREVLNLARFISIQKFRPLVWRTQHPYMIADRMEDITAPEAVRVNPKVDRTISLYGYVRGNNMKQGDRVHLAGVGDFDIHELDILADPCPLPGTEKKKRTLGERDRLIYAPFSDVGGLLYDKDAVYIDIPDHKVQFGGDSATEADDARHEGIDMIRRLASTKHGVDEKLASAEIQLVAGGRRLKADWDGGAEHSDEDEEYSDEDDDEDDDGTGSDEEGGGAKAMGRGMPKAVPEAGADGRVRRRAVFDDGAADDDDGDDDDGASDASGSDEEEEASEREEEEEEEEGMGADALRWKSDMLARAQALFSRRAVDLQRHVYGETAVASGASPTSATLSGRGGDDERTHGARAALFDDDEDGDGPSGSDDGSGDDDFFKPVRRGGTAGAAPPDADAGADVDDADVDALDSCRVAPAAGTLAGWEDDALVESLRDRFVTGDWAKGAERAEAAPGSDEEGDDDNEDEVYGDFEDVEAGVSYGGEDAATAAAQKAIADVEEEERRAKKAAKKAAFDAAFDSGDRSALASGDGAAADGEGEAEAERQDDGGGKKKKRRAPGPADEGPSYAEHLKAEAVERQTRTKAALDAMDPLTRMTLEGLRPGAYVRVALRGVPCELSENFAPTRPLLLGGMPDGEQGLHFMQIRFKRHRWYNKVLKTRDPLVFSVGWRRYQSVPIYSVEDHNGRHRMIKYTPEHMHCRATFWAPAAPQNTGVLALQSLDNSLQGWRISGTGVVLELDASIAIQKKLRLVGHPFKISKHTAFVKDMFNSRLEVSKFEGASIRTVSGIRGTIKKGIKAGFQGSTEGSFRAKFEDKIVMADIVFLKAWVGVNIPKFYNPVTNLLGPTQAPAPRELKPHKGTDDAAAPLLEEAVVTQATPGVPEDAAAAAEVEADEDDGFAPARTFAGARPGAVFKLGPRGLGYYKDLGPMAVAKRARADPGTGAREEEGGEEPTAAALQPAEAQAGWAGMRTVAQLRRALGVGAPREADSLYKDIVRPPKAFGALRIPKALQAELPFKSKPKVQAPRKRKSLEGRRAVVLEPAERKAAALLQQLNAIRNDKAVKRRAKAAAGREKAAKRKAADAEWRTALARDERKKRYVEKAQAERAANSSKFSKFSKRERDG